MSTSTLAAQRVVEDHDLASVKLALDQRHELTLVLVALLGEIGGAVQAARRLHEA